MKKLILAATIAVMSASSFAADDHSGFRVGGGFGTDIGKYKLRNMGTDDNGAFKVEADPSFVLEAGYDINSIFAVNVKGSATGFKDYQNSRSGKNNGTVYDVAIEGEAGYTFDFDRGISIKPYAAFGGVMLDRNTSKLLGYTKKNENAFKARGAAGVRMTLDSGLYVDGRIQATDYTPKGQSFNRTNDLVTQGLMTVGYKF
ncbi:porin family protein [Vibrio agarivorans]|uniref:Porin family protein n=1 Tax=Vibrio agarivorans TaxID=153622 RepID=A0ABT7XYJ5_9VIBR|nr:porin family protein [Vibrio agarivorans]